MSNFLYEPKINNAPSSLRGCIDADKFELLCKEINNDETLSLQEQRWLKLLATRFITFKYEKLADFYAYTGSNMKVWLEKLRCVIIDDDLAIQRGYFKYLEDYSKYLAGIVDEK